MFLTDLISHHPRHCSWLLVLLIFKLCLCVSSPVGQSSDFSLSIISWWTQWSCCHLLEDRQHWLAVSLRTNRKWLQSFPPKDQDVHHVRLNVSCSGQMLETFNLWAGEWFLLIIILWRCWSCLSVVGFNNKLYLLFDSLFRCEFDSVFFCLSRGSWISVACLLQIRVGQVRHNIDFLEVISLLDSSDDWREAVSPRPVW